MPSAAVIVRLSLDMDPTLMQAGMILELTMPAQQLMGKSCLNGANTQFVFVL